MKRASYLTDHASRRAIERLAGEGLDPEPIIRRAQAWAQQNGHRDVAVRLLRLDHETGDTGRPLMERESNGSDLWAVIRHGDIRTFMWRRSEQPATPAAMSVDQVMLKGWKAK